MNETGNDGGSVTVALPDEPPAVERAAKAIYESKLLVQPRDPWGGGNANVTEIFCMQTARAALDAAADEESKHYRKVLEDIVGGEYDYLNDARKAAIGALSPRSQGDRR